MRQAIVLALALAGSLLLAGPSAAHRGAKAEPRIAAAVSENAGLVRLITVRVTDVDSGEPVRGATVVAQAEMTRPHLMRTARWQLGEGPAGVFRAKVKFPMPASWTVRVGVSGPRVVSATSQLAVRIERGGGAAPPAAAGVPDLTALPTLVEDELSGRDLTSMAVLWLHGVAALGWIVGVLVMVIVLSAQPGVLAAGLRARLRHAYLRWGAWLHWSLVPAIVLTGIYNMLVVTPFPLAWRPSEVRRLAETPFGALYEAVLIVKLGLFAALLITGTQVLLRTLQSERDAVVAPVPRGFLGTVAAVLGLPGIAYLATVPLILAAAMALRYIHILSHVADVLRSG